MPAQAQRKSDFRDSLDFLADDGIMTQEEMEEEAMGIYNRCVADIVKSSFFDCECVGGAFLTAREAAGPYETQYNLMKGIYNGMPECVDSPTIAGKAFEECMMFSKISRRTATNNPEYCTCVAHGTVEQFSQSPSLYSRTIERMKGQAQSLCTDEYPADPLVDRK